MIEIIVYDKSANDIMDIVRELRKQGMIQGVDFDFAYNKARYSQDDWQCVEPQHTVFSFHTEKYATLFALKYS